MTASTSRLAYEDCFQAMDEALADPKGVRFRVLTEDAATYFRMRCNRARAIDRKDNRMVYDEDHPLYGRSQYDRIVIKIKIIKGVPWVYLEQIALNVIGKIESLAALGDAPIEKVEMVDEAIAPTVSVLRRV